jgi:hypothetical protein
MVIFSIFFVTTILKIVFLKERKETIHFLCIEDFFLKLNQITGCYERNQGFSIV